MSHQHDTEQVANSGELNSAEETSKLLVDATSQGCSGNTMSRLQKAQSYCCSTNGPTSGATPALVTQKSLSATSSTKPVLIRQERTTSSYLASPQLSTLGTSEEVSSDEDRTISYQLMPSAPANRCRTCRNERRSSNSPNSVICMTRSVSKESVGRVSPNPQGNSGTIPPVYVTGSPSASGGSSSRIIRQSSQPESTSLSCSKEISCSHAHASSLRQLKDPSDQISGIAADALRVG